MAPAHPVLVPLPVAKSILSDPLFRWVTAAASHKKQTAMAPDAQGAFVLENGANRWRRQVPHFSSSRKPPAPIRRNRLSESSPHSGAHGGVFPRRPLSRSVQPERPE